MGFEQLLQDARTQFNLSKSKYIRTGIVDDYLKRLSKMTNISVEALVKESL